MDGNLKRLREQRALSLTDLSRMTNLSRVTINRVENGRQKPMPRTIRKLAEALQVKVEELTSNQVKHKDKKPSQRFGEGRSKVPSQLRNRELK